MLAGYLPAAFFGFGAPASLLIGWLTDVVDRRNLFVIVVVIGEVGALCSAFATTYSQVSGDAPDKAKEGMASEHVQGPTVHRFAVSDVVLLYETRGAETVSAGSVKKEI